MWNNFAIKEIMYSCWKYVVCVCVYVCVNYAHFFIEEQNDR